MEKLEVIYFGFQELYLIVLELDLFLQLHYCCRLVQNCLRKKRNHIVFALARICTQGNPGSDSFRIFWRRLKGLVLMISQIKNLLRSSLESINRRKCSNKKRQKNKRARRLSGPSVSGSLSRGRERDGHGKSSVTALGV